MVGKPFAMGGALRDDTKNGCVADYFGPDHAQRSRTFLSF